MWVISVNIYYIGIKNKNLKYLLFHFKVIMSLLHVNITSLMKNNFRKISKRFSEKTGIVVHCKSLSIGVNRRQLDFQMLCFRVQSVETVLLKFKKKI